MLIVVLRIIARSSFSIITTVIIEVVSRRSTIPVMAVIALVALLLSTRLISLPVSRILETVARQGRRTIVVIVHISLLFLSEVFVILIHHRLQIVTLFVD